MNRQTDFITNIDYWPVLRHGALLAALMVLASGAAFARGDQSQDDMSASRMSQQQLPQEQSEDGISYREGGIGIDEAQAMKQAASDYPLMLSFADYMDGAHAYVADVDVTIKDSQGNTEFDISSEAPLLLLDLPQGSYEVSVNYEGQTLQRQVQVQPQQTERVYFEWNQPAA